MYTQRDITTLAAIVSAVDEGLNVERLLFARYLVRTGRVSDALSNEQATDSVPMPLRLMARPDRVQAIPA